MENLLYKFSKNLKVKIFENPKRFLFAIITMGLLLGCGQMGCGQMGCGQMGRQGELLEELLQEEPSFERVLARKDEVNSQIEQLKVQLDQEERSFQSKVSDLRNEFNSKKIRIRQQINQLHLELEPERQRINLLIAQKSQELKFNLDSLKALKGMRKKVRKLLEGKKHLELPQTEKSHWQERLAYLEGRIENLDKQISKIKENLRKLKIKKALLRL